MKLKNQNLEPDILTLLETGHFNFALTESVYLFRLKNVLC